MSEVLLEEEKRAANRARMPSVAGFVDELRAHGIASKVLYARENGITVGKPPQFDPDKVFQIPANYRRPAGGWK